jgi:hypothetical protein
LKVMEFDRIASLRTLESTFDAGIFSFE